MPLYYFMSKWFLAPQRIRTSICGPHLLSRPVHTVSWIFSFYLGNLWYNLLKMRLHQSRMRRKEWRKDVRTAKTKKSNKITEIQCVSHLFVYFLSHFGFLTLFAAWMDLCAINISSQSFRGWPIDKIIICIKYWALFVQVSSDIYDFPSFQWVYNWKLCCFEMKWWQFFTTSHNNSSALFIRLNAAQTLSHGAFLHEKFIHANIQVISSRRRRHRRLKSERSPLRIYTVSNLLKWKW